MRKWLAAKACGQPAEAGGSVRAARKNTGLQSANALNFSLVKPTSGSDCQKMMNLCCFQPLCLWSFIVEKYGTGQVGPKNACFVYLTKY